MEEVEIEIDYSPRLQFVPFHNRVERFACIVAHRRAGKTVACIHDLQKDALTCQLPGPRCSYIAPSYKQAKTVAWDYLKHAAGPLYEYGAKPNESELRMDYPNGGQVRLFGADNYDALRGMYNDSVVLDEYADFDPRAWPEVIRPTLSDRKGRATFIGSPKGHNQLYDIHQRAQKDKDYYSLVLKASETGIIDPAELESNRLDLTEEQYAQEYECSFEAAILGAYYGKLMAQAEREGRIRTVPHDPSGQVWAAWDIGGDHDATAIWFCQVAHKDINIIDYYEAVGSDTAPHAIALQQKPYNYAGHFLPHDAGPKRVGSDKSYKDFLEGHGLKNLIVLPVSPREAGINGARLSLPRCFFDAEKCKRGIEALKMYRSEYDDKNKVLRASPVHDWASHGADAFRYLAIGLDGHVTKSNFSRKIVYPKLGVA